MAEVPFKADEVKRLKTERPEVANQICEAWPVVKPILQLIKSLPFVPQAVKDAIDWIIKFGDALCPGAAKSK